MIYIDRIENEASNIQQTKASPHTKFDVRPLLNKIKLVFSLNHQNENSNQTYNLSKLTLSINITISVYTNISTLINQLETLVSDGKEF